MKRRDLLKTVSLILSVPFCMLSVYSAEQPDEISVADNLFNKSEFFKSREIYRKIRNIYAKSNQLGKWKYCTVQIIRCSRQLADLSAATDEYFQYCKIVPIAPLEFIPINWLTSSAFLPNTKPDPQVSFNILRQSSISNLNPAVELLASTVLAASLDHSFRNIGLHHLRKLAAMQNDSESNNADNNNKSTAESNKQTELMNNLSHNVMLIADAVLWKERIPTLRNEKELVSMRRLLEKIPLQFRAGAFFLFGRAEAQVGLLEEAVISMMKIPIQYKEDTVLVLSSLLESAKLLDKLNRKKQAEQLRNEAKELRKSVTIQ
ncbi:MAG: hypothetical protein LBE18_07835 [Planctomycetaceae bacterium]|jgi:hypothetical protein|nr:hypothetical protein [Planctomycetaceae bacterium]